MDVTVRGADSLAKVSGAAVRTAPELRKDLLKGIRTAAKPTLAAIRFGAQELPQRGGLADALADAKYVIRTRTSGVLAGIRIEGRWPGHDIKSLDRGRLRHPLFDHAGNKHAGRRHWFQQDITPGFFSRPIERDLWHVQTVVLKTMDDFADKIHRRASS